MLAVLFVVEEPSKGYRLAYRFPPEDVGAEASSESMATLNELCKDSGGKTVARLLRPKERTMCNCPFQLSFNNLLFVGRPTQTLSTQSSSTNPTEDESTEKRITFFNVVFAMEWLRSDTRHNDDTLNNVESRCPTLDVVREVAERLSLSLLCEETRCSFLSQAVHSLSLKQGQSEDRRDPSHHDHDHLRDSHSDDEQEAAEGGAIAALLADVYSSLLLKHSLGLTVNGWLDLSVRLRPSTEPVLMDRHAIFYNGSYFSSLDGHFNPIQSLSSNTSLSDAEVISTFRPYQTMLLLKPESSVIEALPPDSSYQLLALVRAANPLLSFRELSVTTGVPLRQVHKLSAHLSFWGQAAVIDTIVMENQYRLLPGANGRASLEFHTQFRGVQSLYRVLSFFRPNQSLGDILREHVPPRSHLVFLHMLIWLLQHGLLQQVHPYVYLFRPLSAEYLSMAARGSLKAPLTMEDSGDDSTDDDQQDAVASLFKCVVFHLLNAVEPQRRQGDGREGNGVRLLELLWREHVTRQQFEAVLSTYSDHLYVCWHP